MMENWQFAAIIFGIGVSWGTTITQLNSLKKDVKAHWDKINKMNDKIIRIETKMGINGKDE